MNKNKILINKKGLSPLIAVIVIVGFTIVLAFVIMEFGQTFIKKEIEEYYTLDCSNLNIDI